MFTHPELGIRIEHRQIGGQHVFTSPDMPGLYVAHADRLITEQSIPSAVDMLRRMDERKAARTHVDRRTAVF